MNLIELTMNSPIFDLLKRDIDEKIQDVAANFHDSRTNLAKKRRIKVVIEFDPVEERENSVILRFTVGTDLAPIERSGAMIETMNEDGEVGAFIAVDKLVEPPRTLRVQGGE